MPRLALLLLTTCLAAPAVAHPLGRTEYSLRAGVEAGDDGLRLVVMGEIPVAEVIMGMGRLAGGQPPTQAHQSQWNQARLEELAAGQTLTVDGVAQDLTWSPSGSALNGRAIDGFFVYVVEAKVPSSALDEDVTVVLQDDAWRDKPMVFAAQVRARGDWTLAARSAPDDWTADAASRTLTVRFTRPAASP